MLPELSFSLVLGSPTTGYKLLPSDSLELPPPDYDDVVNSPPGTVAAQHEAVPPGSQPTAPPLSELELAAAENPSTQQTVAGTGGPLTEPRSSTDYGGTRGKCISTLVRETT